MSVQFDTENLTNAVYHFRAEIPLTFDCDECGSDVHAKIGADGEFVCSECHKSYESTDIGEKLAARYPHPDDEDTGLRAKCDYGRSSAIFFKRNGGSYSIWVKKGTVSIMSLPETYTIDRLEDCDGVAEQFAGDIVETFGGTRTSELERSQIAINTELPSGVRLELAVQALRSGNSPFESETVVYNPEIFPSIDATHKETGIHVQLFTDKVSLLGGTELDSIKATYEDVVRHLREWELLDE